MTLSISRVEVGRREYSGVSNYLPSRFPPLHRVPQLWQRYLDRKFHDSHAIELEFVLTPRRFIGFPRHFIQNRPPHHSSKLQLLFPNNNSLNKEVVVLFHLMVKGKDGNLKNRVISEMVEVIPNVTGLNTL
jgi:hypothetical protein